MQFPLIAPLQPGVQTDLQLHAFQCAFLSGNNWLCEIVKLIHADGYKDKIDRSRLTTPITYDRYLDREPQYEEAVRWESPRVFYSHLYEPLLPTQLRQGKGKVCLLCLFLSNYTSVNIMAGLTEKVESYFDLIFSYIKSLLDTSFGFEERKEKKRKKQG